MLSDAEIGISNEDVALLIENFDGLLAFAHEASTTLARRRMRRSQSKGAVQEGYPDLAMQAQEYSLGLDDRSQPNAGQMKTHRSKSFCFE